MSEQTAYTGFKILAIVACVLSVLSIAWAIMVTTQHQSQIDNMTALRASDIGKARVTLISHVDLNLTPVCSKYEQVEVLMYNLTCQDTTPRLFVNDAVQENPVYYELKKNKYCDNQCDNSRLCLRRVSTIEAKPALGYENGACLEYVLKPAQQYEWYTLYTGN